MSGELNPAPGNDSEQKLDIDLILQQASKFAKNEEELVDLIYKNGGRYCQFQNDLIVLPIRKNPRPLVPQFRSNDIKFVHLKDSVKALSLKYEDAYFYGIQVANERGVQTSNVLDIQAFTERNSDLEHQYQRFFSDSPRFFSPHTYYYFDEMGRSLKLITLPGGIDDSRSDLDIYPGHFVASKLVESNMQPGDFELVGSMLNEFQRLYTEDTDIGSR